VTSYLICTCTLSHTCVSTMGVTSLVTTLQQCKHTSLPVTRDKYCSHSIQIQTISRLVSAVHLIVHTSRGFDSIKHVSVMLTCVTAGARSTVGNMLRQVIAPLHQEQNHQDPLLIVRFCLCICCIACAFTRIPVVATCTLSGMHIIALITRRQSQNVIDLIPTHWST